VWMNPLQTTGAMTRIPARMVMVAVVWLASLLADVSGLQVQRSFLNDRNVSALDYAKVYNNTDALPFLLQRSIIDLLPHQQAAYAPFTYNRLGPEMQAYGPVVILDPELYVEVTDEFLCTRPPPVLTINQNFLRTSSARGFKRLRPAPLSDPRWPDLNLSVPIAGSVLVVSRGGNYTGCTFQLKSFYAEEAGAVALVVTAEWPPTVVANDAPVLMTGSDDFNDQLRSMGLMKDTEVYVFTIPSVFITQQEFVDVRRRVGLYLNYIGNILNQVELNYYVQLFTWNVLNNNSSGTPVVPPAMSSSSSTGGAFASSSSSSTADPGTGFLSSSTGAAPDSSSSGGSSDSSSSGSPSDPSSSSSSTGVSRRLLHLSAEWQRITDEAWERAHESIQHIQQRKGRQLDGAPEQQLPALFDYVPMMALIDQEQPGSPQTPTLQNYDSFKIAAYFLLVLPSLWFVVACIYVTRKCGTRWRERHRRDLRNGLIPTVTYRALHRDGHNEKPALRSSVTAQAGEDGGDPPSSPGSPAGTSFPGRKSHHHALSLADNSAAAPFLLASPSGPRGGEREAKEQIEEGAGQGQGGRAIEMHSIMVGSRSSSSSRPPVMSSAAAGVLLVDDDDDGVMSPLAPSQQPAARTTTASAVSATPASVREGGIGIDLHGKKRRIIGTACAICLCDLEDGEKLSLLPCHHAFHGACITPWLEKSDDCPSCRGSILDALHEDEHSRCTALANWCCPVLTPQQREEALRRQVAAQAREQEVERQRAEAREGRSPGEAGVAMIPLSSHGLEVDANGGGSSSSMSAGLHSSPLHHDREPNNSPTSSGGNGGHSLASPLSRPLSGSSAHQPYQATAEDLARADKLYHASGVRSAAQQLRSDMHRSGLAEEVSEVAAAVQEFDLVLSEYVSTAVRGSLNQEQALLLLGQAIAEVGVITRHAVGQPELAEALFTCESVLSFAQEVVKRAQYQPPRR
jgi:hypothetical protein